MLFYKNITKNLKKLFPKNSKKSLTLVAFLKYNWYTCYFVKRKQSFLKKDIIENSVGGANSEKNISTKK